MDIFIVEKPPRYDQQSKDQTGIKVKLTKYANGVLASTLGLNRRTFIVDQVSLARTSERSRAEIFQQYGLHLTTKGINFYTSNILNTMKECYEETVLLLKQSLPIPGWWL